MPRDHIFEAQLGCLTKAQTLPSLHWSGHAFLETLRHLLTANPDVNLAWTVSILYAALLNPRMPGARLFVEEVLGEQALPFFGYTDGMLHINRRMYAEDVEGFWSTTIADAQRLAGDDEIRDYHWIASMFLGDGNEREHGKLVGELYAASFEGQWTNASQAVRHVTHSKPSDWLLPYLRKCGQAHGKEHQYPSCLALTLREDRVVVEPVDVWPATTISAGGSSAGHVFRTSLSLRGFASASILRDFEQLINRTDVTEEAVQNFLECHLDLLFLIGDHKNWLSQVVLTPQLLLSYEAQEGGRPDFLLQDADDLWDILEIKRPDVRLARGRPRRRRLTDAVQEAVAQIREYSRFFADKAQAMWARQRYGVDVLTPKLYVIIGRDTSFQNAAEKKSLLQTADSVSVLTYDDILRIARRRWCIAGG